MDFRETLSNLKSLKLYCNDMYEKDPDEVWKEDCEALNVAISAMQELQLYKDTGLTPDQLREIDKLYSEQAKELGEYKKLGTFEELKILKETHLTVNELVKIFCGLKRLKEYEVLGDLEDVRQAVDNQKAKKPYIAEVDSRLFDYDTCRKTVDVFKCPKCDSFLSVVNEEKYTQHCPKCGQKLDWSDEE